MRARLASVCPTPLTPHGCWTKRLTGARGGPTIRDFRAGRVARCQTGGIPRRPGGMAHILKRAGWPADSTLRACTYPRAMCLDVGDPGCHAGGYPIYGGKDETVRRDVDRIRRREKRLLPALVGRWV